MHIHIIIIITNGYDTFYMLFISRDFKNIRAAKWTPIQLRC
jgi:hypothetical protein